MLLLLIHSPHAEQKLRFVWFCASTSSRKKNQKKSLGRYQTQRQHPAILKSIVSTTRVRISFNVFIFCAKCCIKMSAQVFAPQVCALPSGRQTFCLCFSHVLLLMHTSLCVYISVFMYTYIYIYTHVSPSPMLIRGVLRSTNKNLCVSEKNQHGLFSGVFYLKGSLCIPIVSLEDFLFFNFISYRNNNVW